MRLVSLWILMICLLSLSSFVDSFFGLASRRKVFENPTIARWISGTYHPDLDNNALPSFDDGYLCHAMKLTGKQRRICLRERGYPNVLMESLRLSTRACQKEFQFERWNCTLGFTRRNILRKASRESAVLTTFAAAGMTYAIAKACSSGQLDRCSCDFNENRPSARRSWIWGGCSDNIREGRKQTESFFKYTSQTKSTSYNQQISRHNAQLGIAVVREASKRVCKCHGVSGSCTLRTCYTVLLPFKHAAKSIHSMYRSASKKKLDGPDFTTNDLPEPTTDETTEAPRESSQSANRRRSKTKQSPLEPALWVTEDSPDFCARSKVSYGVSGRRCHTDNPWKRRRKSYSGGCDQLCCGPNKSVARYEEISRKCNCTYAAFSVNCLECRRKEMRYYCK